MAIPYNGSSAGKNEGDQVTVVTPQDTDPRNAASVNTALTALADWAEYFSQFKATHGFVHPNTDTLVSTLAGVVVGRNISFSDLGAVGNNQERALVDVIQHLAAATYITAAGEYEIAVNCFWQHGSTKWQRLATGPASVARFSGNSLVLLQKATGAGGGQWTDTVGAGGWDTEAALDLISFASTQGDVLGMTSAGIVTFGRPRAPLVVVGSGGGAPAFKNSWGAATIGSPTPPAFWVDGFNVCHLEGQTVGGSGNTVIFTLPFPPASGKDDYFAVVKDGNLMSTIGIKASGDVQHFQTGPDPATSLQLAGITFRK